MQDVALTLTGFASLALGVAVVGLIRFGPWWMTGPIRRIFVVARVILVIEAAWFTILSFGTALGVITITTDEAAWVLATMGVGTGILALEIGGIFTHYGRRG